MVSRSNQRLVIGVAFAVLLTFALPEVARSATPRKDPKRRAGVTQVVAKSWRFPLMRSNRWGFRVSQAYGAFGRIDRGRYHTGIDVAVPCGTPVRAIADGEIVEIRKKDRGGFGKLVLVRHYMQSGPPLYALYAHLQSVPGDIGPVKRGQLLGRSGTTGRSTGCHLHFAMRDRPGTGRGYTTVRPEKRGYVDPAKFLARRVVRRLPH